MYYWPLTYMSMALARLQFQFKFNRSSQSVIITTNKFKIHSFGFVDHAQRFNIPKLLYYNLHTKCCNFFSISFIFSDADWWSLFALQIVFEWQLLCSWRCVYSWSNLSLLMVNSKYLKINVLLELLKLHLIGVSWNCKS